MTEQPEHWPTERMVQEGHADYATFEDLEGLDVNLLQDIAVLCEADEFAPEECIPCRAHVKVLEQREEAEPDPVPAATEQAAEVSEDPVQNISLVPPAERFASQVRVLNLLVEEMLSGPPIPPRHVSMEELAVLIVGAEKWVQMTAEVELAPGPAAMRHEIQRVIAKIRREV